MLREHSVKLEHVAFLVKNLNFLLGVLRRRVFDEILHFWIVISLPFQLCNSLLGRDRVGHVVFLQFTSHIFNVRLQNGPHSTENANCAF